MDEELKRLVEAILFAAARRLEIAEIAKLCKRSEDDVRSVLKEWKEQLPPHSPTMLLEEGEFWKLTVRERYVHVVKKVVTQTEVPKSILETLAVVAYKAPVMQSKVVKIRTNKAYEHLKFLEEAGFLTRQKHGRSKMLKLTPKFFEYFDLDPSKLKKKFGNVAEVEKAIEEKEAEIEQIEADQRKQTEEALGTPDIILEGKKLETYDSVEKTDMKDGVVQPYTDKVDELEVYGEDEKAKPEDLHAGESEEELLAEAETAFGEKEAEESAEEGSEESEEAEEPEEAEKSEEETEEPEEEEPVEEPEAEEEKEEAEEETTEEESEEEEPKEEEKEEPEEESEEPEAKEETEEEPEEKPKAEEKKPEKKPEKESESKPEEKEPEKESEKEPAEEEPKLTSRERIEKDVDAHKQTLKTKEFEKGKGLYPKGVPEDMQKKIDERIEELLHPKEEEE